MATYKEAEISSASTTDTETRMKGHAMKRAIYARKSSQQQAPLFLLILSLMLLTINSPGQEALSRLDAEATDTASAPVSSEAALSTANGKIAFVSDRSGNQEIYSMNPNGTGVLRLTNNPSDDLSPVWSPDGTKIIFSSDRSGNYQIYSMNANGTGVTRLTNNAFDELPFSWKPDGTKIAYMSGVLNTASPFSSSFDIKVMNANGSSPVTIAANSANDISPVFSPNGARIAFSSNRDGDYEIYTVAATGGALTKLTNNSNNDVTPTWKPDGTKIAFATDRNESFPIFFGEIYVMNANGSLQTNLTNSSPVDVYPNWSPDGAQIAFMSGELNLANPQDTEFDIHVMSATGASPTNITHNLVGDYFPNWQALQTTPTGLTISGRVTKAGTATAICGVTMRLTSPTPAGFAPRTATTNATGNYSFADLPAGRTYILTPSSTFYIFTPTSRNFTNLAASQSNITFTATLKPDTIAGAYAGQTTGNTSNCTDPEDNGAFSFNTDVTVNAPTLTCGVGKVTGRITVRNAVGGQPTQDLVIDFEAKITGPANARTLSAGKLTAVSPQGATITQSTVTGQWVKGLNGQPDKLTLNFTARGSAFGNACNATGKVLVFR
jgi:Tol biopolymer transport system component